MPRSPDRYPACQPIYSRDPDEPRSWFWTGIALAMLGFWVSMLGYAIYSDGIARLFQGMPEGAPYSHDDYGPVERWVLEDPRYISGQRN